MIISLYIPDDYIIDLLNRAAIGYWCSGLSTQAYKDNDTRSCWEALVHGEVRSIKVSVNRTCFSKGERSSHIVTLKEIQKAFQVIRDYYPHHLDAVMGNDDAKDGIIGDLFLQVCTFGDIVFE